MEEVKSNQGSKIAMIILAVVAVIGVGFGIFGMIQVNGKNAEIDKLKTENVQKDEVIVQVKETLGTEVVEVTEENKTEVAALTGSDKYIYLGKWGIKLRVPDSLGEVQYAFDGYATNQTFCVSGQKKGAQAVMDFADYLGGGYPMGCLTRTADKEGPFPSAQKVYEDEQYAYVYSGPQAVMTSDPGLQNEEIETVGLVRKMLTEGISKF